MRCFRSDIPLPTSVEKKKTARMIKRERGKERERKEKERERERERERKGEREGALLAVCHDVVK